MTIDAAHLKQVMRRYVTGVMVLTVPDGAGMHAVTMNAVASVSLNPILMLVCIEKNAYSHGLVHSTGVFALNILTDKQQELGDRFAYDREARNRPMDLVRGYKGQTGSLIFEESLGFLDCRVTAEYPGGDHTIYVGEVVDMGFREGSGGPLVYYGGKFRGL